MSLLEQLESEKYISVETFKKSGDGIKTPVWFVIRDETIFVVTRDQTGKFKRLKNNTKVNLAICSMKGDIKGEWFSGIATILPEEQVKEAVKWRDKKYGFLAKIAKFASKSKGELCAFSIKLD
ncbi:PPOX class F420-dependent oxidoreductase [Nitrosopumilus sp.]|uniref:PPOX class F420-dependent oxidoreductase n=1 Tax=Nitrosopumilus sp. TaxID=2024843 RepID=UPI00260E0738|nr:PPOX class F420-dependent oxidoreductase [Nitrosopumilus sp.]